MMLPPSPPPAPGTGRNSGRNNSAAGPNNNNKSLSALSLKQRLAERVARIEREEQQGSSVAPAPVGNSNDNDNEPQVGQQKQPPEQGQQQQESQPPQPNPPHNPPQTRPLSVWFLHLDWGIGGAESLMLQLAQASLADWEQYYYQMKDGGETNNPNHNNNHNNIPIRLCTTRCDPTHCFAALKPGGALHPYLSVHGAVLPQDFYRGRLRALCSTCRLLYLSVAVKLFNTQSNDNSSNRHPDVIVLDVLPTPLPLLRLLFPQTAFLFYCHFPDQLLTQQQQQQQWSMKDDKNDNSNNTTNNNNNTQKSLYRRIIDGLENATLPYADEIVVNSQFTRQTVLETFSSLQKVAPKERDSKNTKATNNNNHPQHNDDVLPVLYPALDTAALDVDVSWDDIAAELPATLRNRLQQGTTTADGGNGGNEIMIQPIVSLNRFERKKNIALLLRAVEWLYEQQQSSNSIPPVLIAGGYDPANLENVQHLAELQHYVANSPTLADHVYFGTSISDQQRTYWLRRAKVVAYTPAREHFGIVPLEAMYCQTPIVALASGGPLETVRHGETGFLTCNDNDNDHVAFGKALQRVLALSDQEYEQMGRKARQHVIQTFGQAVLQQKWRALLRRTQIKGQARRQRERGMMITLLLVLLLVLAVAGMLSLFFRQGAGGDGEL